MDDPTMIAAATGGGGRGGGGKRGRGRGGRGRGEGNTDHSVQHDAAASAAGTTRGRGGGHGNRGGGRARGGGNGGTTLAAAAGGERDKKNTKHGLPQGSHRRWIFTQQGEKEPELAEGALEKLVYGIWQLEAAATTGNLHWQGYFIVNNSMRASTLVKAGCIFKERINYIDVAWCTTEENIKYCSKTRAEGGDNGGRPDGAPPPTIIGKPPREQPRVKLDEQLARAAEMVIEGATADEVLQEAPVAYMLQKKAILDLAREVRWKTQSGVRQIYVEVFWGSQGTGKTYKAVNRYDSEEVFVRTANHGQWWDGYAGQPVLILDDFYGDIDPTRMVQVLEGSQGHTLMPTKGGFVEALWTHVTITSNVAPWRWYSKRDSKYSEETWAALVKAVLDRIPIENIKEYTGVSLRQSATRVKAQPYLSKNSRKRDAVRVEEEEAAAGMRDGVDVAAVIHNDNTQFLLPLWWSEEDDSSELLGNINDEDRYSGYEEELWAIGDDVEQLQDNNNAVVAPFASVAAEKEATDGGEMKRSDAFFAALAKERTMSPFDDDEA